MFGAYFIHWLVQLSLVVITAKGRVCLINVFLLIC